MVKGFYAFVLAALLAFVSLPVQLVQAAAADTVLINEIRLGGSGITLQNGQVVDEYITIHNSGTQSVLLDGWFIEYAKNATSGLDPAFCSAGTWIGFANVTVVRHPLSGVLAPGDSLLLPMQLNNTGHGSIRLLDDSNSEATVVQDLVGWVSGAPCSEAAPTVLPSTGAGESLFRYRACEANTLADSGDNSKDFAKAPSAPYTAGLADPKCSEEPTEEKNCNTVAITEVFPNVKGADAGKEFIELYNPGLEPFDLFGCGVGVTGSTREYLFPAGTVLNPGEYRAFYDSTTGITLPNSANTELVIISVAQEFVQTTYPGSIKEDFSWALIDGDWQSTNNPTPGAANTPSVIEVVTSQSGGLGPCPAGKYRNPATNRCKSLVSTASSLTPCKAGQFRNPETNSCKSLASTASALVPCKAGQERNPETNRCRKIASDGSTLKPCAEGQERNPETNRCRKVQATLASATTADKQENGSSPANYAILGLIGASAIGYGAFEYRHDIRNKLLSLKSRFFSSGK